MHKLLAVTALLAAAPVAVAAAPIAATGISMLSGFTGARATNPELMLVGGMSGGGGGMSGGNAAGMGGGAGMGGNTGGMGGGNAGGMGGGSNRMNGGGAFGGNMFGDAGAAVDPTAPEPTGASGQYYTYRCVTPAGRCLFVAPAALRDNSLRSGAGCACPDGRGRGQVE